MQPTNFLLSLITALLLAALAALCLYPPTTGVIDSVEAKGRSTGILPIGQVVFAAKPPVKPKPPSSVAMAKNIARQYASIDHPQAQHVVKLVYTYAKQHNVRPALVLGLIGAESSFRSHAISPVGAVGYTQVWPKWHQDKIAGRNIQNTATNIEVGIKVLKECFKRRRTERAALACYNGATRQVDIDKYTTAVYLHMKRIQGSV